jgi:hypothetical protein
MTTAEGTRGEAITPRLTYTLSGKRILVFDDLFTDEFVDTFGAFLLRQNYVPRPSFDNELSAPLPNELLESLPAIPDVTAEILERFYPQMTASPAPQTLTHGYSAAIRFGDSCSLHRDIACDDCVTFLYYGEAVRVPHQAQPAREVHDQPGPPCGHGVRGNIPISGGQTNRRMVTRFMTTATVRDRREQRPQHRPK